MRILVLALFAMLSAAPAARQAGTSEVPPETYLIPKAQRKPAPNFSLTDLDGKPLSLSRYKGRVVLLDFWAVDCGGCKVEIPWYVDFDARYRPKGLSVIGLDMYGETPEVIRPFVEKSRIIYEIAVGTDAIGNTYGLKDMPLTILIDRDGNIAASHVGIVDRVALEKSIQLLL